MSETMKLRDALRGAGIKYRTCDRGGSESVCATEWDFENGTHFEYVESFGKALVGGEYHLTEFRAKRHPRDPLTASDVIGLLGIGR